MKHRYHPPTRKHCDICDELNAINNKKPIIETINGKASASNGYPFHDWYNFVLGFTPTFPEYILSLENIKPEDVVLDPFAGSGTTQLVCKLHRIQSIGIDANDFMVFAAEEKLNWERNIDDIKDKTSLILKKVKVEFDSINWENDIEIAQRTDRLRPEMLDKRYISDKPYLKIELIKNAMAETKMPQDIRSLMNFALSAILVPASNVKYGPGFGVGKIKDDVDVYKLFNNKLDLMINDLQRVTVNQKETLTKSVLGDSRHLSDYVAPNTISLMITSPPYPGDHEYTKHSRLELIFQGMATDIASFRTIKRRMLRASTTNIYKDDFEKINVENNRSIIQITKEIETRLYNDGATSGFEKLYTRLVWEYFGGMATTLKECYKALKPGGKIALLVSDSHAFKMVHIQTAKILEEIGIQIGYINSDIVLWQLKNTTSHSYQLRENILILQKP